MGFSDDLADLARRLRPNGAHARAVMIRGVAPGVGASTIASELSETYARLSARPVWLLDLDFARNAQARRAALRRDRFDAGGPGFWRCEPDGAARLVIQRRAHSPVFVSRFEHAPGAVRAVRLRSAPDYWKRVRGACGLVVVDAPAHGAAPEAVARDMDGVILVADARRTGRAETDAAQARLEAAGARVLGLVVNRSGAQRSAA